MRRRVERRSPDGPLLAADGVTTLGSSSPRVAFREPARDPATGPGERLLLLDGEPAYELSSWCGTCPFLFERRDGANDTT